MSEVASPASPASSQRSVLDLATAARQPVSAVLQELGSTQTLQELGSTQTGLTSEEAAGRLATVGRNVLASHKVTALGILGRQLRNPLLILLLAAAAVSAATGDPTDGAIITAIVVLSVGLGFINEYRSEVAVAALHADIRHQALVWRDGGQQQDQQRVAELAAQNPQGGHLVGGQHVRADGGQPAGGLVGGQAGLGAAQLPEHHAYRLTGSSPKVQHRPLRGRG